MELMRKVILSACFLSVVITIVDSIKPGEKFSQQLKMIFSLIFITGILSVVLKGSLNFDIPAYADLEYSDDYNSLEDAAGIAVKSETEKNINVYIEDILLKNDVSFDKISSDVNIEEDNSIIINRIDYKGMEFEQAREIIINNMGDVEVNQIEKNK
ncbi:MAG: hypothetical protein K2I33_01150 [Oscillospiraceae bacterium]|nr:hypothetical protein [Oscillospiraceae bacterium]